MPSDMTSLQTCLYISRLSLSEIRELSSFRNHMCFWDRPCRRDPQAGLDFILMQSRAKSVNLHDFVGCKTHQQVQGWGYPWQGLQ